MSSDLLLRPSDSDVQSKEGAKHNVAVEHYWLDRIGTRHVAQDHPAGNKDVEVKCNDRGLGARPVCGVADEE